MDLYFLGLILGKKIWSSKGSKGGSPSPHEYLMGCRFWSCKTCSLLMSLVINRHHHISWVSCAMSHHINITRHTDCLSCGLLNAHFNLLLHHATCVCTLPQKCIGGRDKSKQINTNKRKLLRDITTTIILIVSILIQNWPKLQKAAVWERSDCGGQDPGSRTRRQIFSERLWQCLCIANSNSWLFGGLPQWLSRLRIHLQCRRHRRLGFDPWDRKTPWRKKWQPTQYSCLENPTDRGAWLATVHGVTKSRTWLKHLSTQFCNLWNKCIHWALPKTCSAVLCYRCIDPHAAGLGREWKRRKKRRCSWHSLLAFPALTASSLSGSPTMSRVNTPELLALEHIWVCSVIIRQQAYRQKVSRVHTQEPSVSQMTSRDTQHLWQTTFGDKCACRRWILLATIIGGAYLYLGFPSGSDSKESACNAGELSSIPGSGKSPGEANGCLLQYFAWRIPWTKEPGGLPAQSIGSQRAGHDWVMDTFTFTCINWLRIYLRWCFSKKCLSPQAEVSPWGMLTETNRLLLHPVLANLEWVFLYLARWLSRDTCRRQRYTETPRCCFL